METIKNFTKAVGLHPLVGFGMFAIDWMLFPEELTIVALPLTIGVGLALGIGSSLIQYRSYDKGDWMMSLGKGIMVGVLTAIPTPLPSILTLGGAMAGTAYKLLDRGEDDKTIIEAEVKATAPPPQEEVLGDIIDVEVIEE